MSLAEGQKISEMGLVTTLATDDLITAVDISESLNVRMTYASLLSQLTTDIPSGSGDVTKVGTPVAGEMGRWTGDGTLEGVSGVTHFGGTLNIFGVTDNTVSVSTAVANGTSRLNLAADGGSVSQIRLYGSTASGTGLGVALADKLDLFVNRSLNIRTTGTNDILVGTNDTLAMTIDGTDQSSDFNGNEIHNVGDFYIGDRSTDGSWRFTISGDDLLIQQREAGTYNTKSTISGA